MSTITTTNNPFSSFKPSSFKVQLKNSLATVELLANKITIPSIEQDFMQVPHFTSPQPRPASLLKFGELLMEFQLDENFDSVIELYNYIITSKNPETGVIQAPLETYFIASIFLTTNKNNDNIIINFHDAWIQKMEQIELDAMTDTDLPINVGVNIMFTYFDFSIIPQLNPIPIPTTS